MKKSTKRSRKMMFAFIATIMFGFQSYAAIPFFGVCAHNWGSYNGPSATTLLNLTQQLGCGLYRVDLGTSQYALTDALLSAAGTRGIKLLAILNGTLGNYSASYNEGYAFAHKYAGQISYYQLSNERDVYSLTSGDGTTTDQYNYALYANAKAEIQGLRDGIMAGDPNAKTIVNFTWIHYGFIQRLVNDGINFDIIGIDWYWDDITNVNGLDVPLYLKNQFNKPLWVTEANRWEGSTGGNETAQSVWINQNTTGYYNNMNISAFITYELLDEPGANPNYESNMGLMYNTNSQKPAYNTYKNAIAACTWRNTYFPDVIVTSITYSESTHTFSCVVKNQGNAPTPAGYIVGVGYSVDGIGRTFGIVNGPLAPGASVTIGGGTYTIPNGTHTISAYVDDINRFAESNETNNQLTNTIIIGVSLPDVIVTSLTYNISTGYFSCVVKNQGNASTPSGVVIGVGYSVDGIGRTSGIVNGPLAAGASIAIGSSYYNISSGTHTMSAYVDDINRFTESNETNNQFSTLIMKSAVIIASTIDMADVSKVSLYPNPATTNLTIELPVVQVNEKAQIYNTLGRLVKEINVSSNIQQVNIEYLTNGVYFVRLISSPNISLMFIKQ
jgi:hypothetical protein